MADVLDGQIKAVEAEIAEVKNEIKEVSKQLERIVARLEGSGLSGEQRAELVEREKGLREEKKQLRAKEDRLRKKEEQLREEKLLLLRSTQGDLFMYMQHGRAALYKSRYLSGAHAIQAELQAQWTLQVPTVPRPRQSSLRFGRHFRGLS